MGEEVAVGEGNNENCGSWPGEYSFIRLAAVLQRQDNTLRVSEKAVEGELRGQKNNDLYRFDSYQLNLPASMVHQRECQKGFWVQIGIPSSVDPEHAIPSWSDCIKGW